MSDPIIESLEETVRVLNAAVSDIAADAEAARREVAELLPWAAYGCRVATRGRESRVPAELLARIEAGAFRIPASYYDVEVDA